MATEADGLSAPELLPLMGVTYRQLDHWTRAGYLASTYGSKATTPGGLARARSRTTQLSGSGMVRRYSAEECRVAVRLARLVRAGIPLAVAEPAARAESDRCELPAGVVITLTDQHDQDDQHQGDDAEAA